MEMAAKVKTELAFSGLFPVVGILNKNFRDVITPDEMKPLNDFVDYKIEELTRGAKSDDLLQLMPLVKELQAAALKLKDQLDLHEYYQIEKLVNSSSEPIPTEKVLPKDMRDGLNKLLKIVERVENIKRPNTSKNDTAKPQADSFIDFLVGEFHVARPILKLAISDISRVIEMLGSNLHSLSHDQRLEVWQQLMDVVSYHIKVLIRNVKSMQLQQMLQATSLRLDRLDADRQVPSYYIFLKEENFPSIIFRSPLRIGLEKLLKILKQVEKEHPSITSRTRNPSLTMGVKKWLKFVEQEEKEHPQAYSIAPISTTFFPGRGYLSIKSLENVKCQEDVEEIMQNHKKNLKILNFGWSKTGSSINTCEEVLRRLEPDRNLTSLSIANYSSAKFPNWMVKENWLPRLQSLKLWYCISVKIVPFLPPSLQQLYVYNCDELIQLPPLSNTLRTLNLVNCPKLMVPLVFKKSLGLNEVRIENCSRNESPLFIDLSFLTNLKVLVFARIPDLQVLANLNPTVMDLTIEDCPKLTSLGNLQRCTSLKCLSINKCPMLRREEASSVEGVVEEDIANRLPQVERIVTDEPLLVLELVQQQAFSSIKRLTLKDCAALPNLEKLTSLQDLDIRNCPDVESLPDLPVSLQRLRIEDCPKLKEKYEDGGPLQNTISHIPYTSIH